MLPVAVMLPGVLHVLAMPGNAATSTLVGSVSLNATLLRVWSRLALVRLKVSCVVPLGPTLGGPKAWLTAGRLSTSRAAVLLVVPVPALEEIAPVVLG